MIISELDPFILKFAPGLKTREQIQVTLFFKVDYSGPKAIFGWIPFTSDDGIRAEISGILSARAGAITNRWALQFESAEAALDPAAYDSLEEELSAIASETFLIRELEVHQIIALTPRVEKKSEPPAKPLEKPKPTYAEEIMQPIIEALPAIDGMRILKEYVKEKYPDLANDPVLGFGSVPIPNRMFTGASPIAQDGKLKALFEQRLSDIFDLKGRI